jgi:sulfate adenylyltransferase large subunit
MSDVLAYLARQEQKELLRFVAVGSVDDGKSTLIGRLLHDSHGIYDDQLSAVERASKTRGSAGGKLDLALLTDGLRAEREQGITIDVAYRYFATDKRKFIIADTPGHVQYTRNMATGASTANVALILIDARHGVLKQSRRHAYIASLLGIPQLCVCVNKMDLVEYRQDAFEAIKRDFESFVARLRFREVRFVPISAVEGDNVVHRSERMRWYGDETVLGYLERVPVSSDVNLSDFRYPVQLVARPDLHYRGFAGQIASGVVRAGDDVTVLPSGKRSTVAGIDTFDGSIEEAFAPMSVTLRLSDEVDVSRGDMIVHTGNLPAVARRFEAHLVWMNEQALGIGKSYFLKHTTRMVRASVDAVIGRVDLDTLDEQPAASLELNDIGRVAMSCNQPLYFDAYTRNRQLGAFVVVDALTNNTVGAGMIVDALTEERRARAREASSLVSAADRRARFGHAGAVIAFSGQPATGHESLAYQLERTLFEMGLAAFVIDVGAFDDTRSPSLLADLAEQCVRAGLLTILSTGLPRASDRAELRARFSALELVELGSDGDVDAPSHALRVTLDDPARASHEIVEELTKRGILVTKQGAAP